MDPFTLHSKEGVANRTSVLDLGSVQTQLPQGAKTSSKGILNHKQLEQQRKEKAWGKKSYLGIWLSKLCHYSPATFRSSYPGCQR